MSPDLFYRDICRGYSEINWNGPIFIKHLDIIEQNSLSEIYENALDRAKKLGCETEPQITARLISEGKWTAIKEKSIESCDDEISQLELSKKKISDEFQIDSIYDSLVELKVKKEKLLSEKYSLFNNSAESYANLAYRDYKISISCYEDKELTIKKFGEEFEYLDNFELLALNFSSRELNIEHIKKICISSFFWTAFTLSENYYDFFHIPLSKLTYNQINLLRYGQTYAKIASEYEYPEKYKDNSDKMLMYFYYRKNGGKNPDEIKQDQKQTASKWRTALSGAK